MLKLSVLSPYNIPNQISLFSEVFYYYLTKYCNVEVEVITEKNIYKSIDVQSEGLGNVKVKVIDNWIRYKNIPIDRIVNEIKGEVIHVHFDESMNLELIKELKKMNKYVILSIHKYDEELSKVCDSIDLILCHNKLILDKVETKNKLYLPYPVFKLPSFHKYFDVHFPERPIIGTITNELKFENYIDVAKVCSTYQNFYIIGILKEYFTEISLDLRDLQYELYKILIDRYMIFVSDLAIDVLFTLTKLVDINVIIDFDKTIYTPIILPISLAQYKLILTNNEIKFNELKDISNELIVKDVKELEKKILTFTQYKDEVLKIIDKINEYNKRNSVYEVIQKYYDLIRS